MPQTNFEHSFPAGSHGTDRNNLILDAVRGKRVVHVGCTDWPFTAERLTAGELLHSSLLRVADEVVGIDIDSDGLSTLRRVLGGEYLALDITQCTTDLPALGTFDVVLLPDVLEHVLDENSFLVGAKRLAIAVGASQVIVSTPNALAFRQALFGLFHREVIHPDHKRIHTPHTLAVTLQAAGIQPSAWSYYTFDNGSTWPRRVLDVGSKLAARYEVGYSDGLIVVGEVGNDPI